MTCWLRAGLFAAALSLVLVWGQDAPPPDLAPPQHPATHDKKSKKKHDKQRKVARPSNPNRSLERSIDGREFVSKGIDLGTPKVYDDSLLQSLLSSAQAKLSGIQ